MSNKKLTPRVQCAAWVGITTLTIRQAVPTFLDRKMLLNILILHTVLCIKHAQTIFILIKPLFQISDQLISIVEHISIVKLSPFRVSKPTKNDYQITF